MTLSNVLFHSDSTPFFIVFFQVATATSDGDDDSVTTAIPSGVASSKTNKAHNVEDDANKPASNQMRGAHIVCIDGEQVFTKKGAERIIQRLCEDKFTELYVKVAVERRLNASQFRKTLLEHDSDLFNPNAHNDEHKPTLPINYPRVIAYQLHPGVDFSEQNVSSDALALCINAPSSRALTGEEAALGSFPRRKLKTLPMRPEWQDGKLKQLHRVNSQPFAIELNATEGQPILLLRQVDDFELACQTHLRHHW
jgi:hypothetical protein